MVHILLKSAFFWMLLAAPAMAQSTRMEEAHVHGHGTVSIAVDGPTLTILVETPAYDVLGFEHTASTLEDKRLVAAVRSLLERPGTLLEIPSEAGCSLSGANVSIGPEGNGQHDHGAAGETHSDIEAEYRFTCAAPASIDRIGFPWFEAFPLSKELEIVVLNDRGQNSGVVTPGTPEFQLP